MAVNGKLSHNMSRLDDIGPQFLEMLGRMSASPPFLSISHAARLTGLEPGRIQFIQRELAEWLPGSGDALGSEPIAAHSLDLLRELHERLFVRFEPIEAVRAELQRKQRQLRVIAVTSGKGGVGKTNMAINVALALSRQGSRVLLCDADLGLGNVHVYAGISPSATLLDVVEGRAALRDILADGPGRIRVACGPSGVSELAQLDSDHIRRLGRELAGLAGDFDVAILDTGAGISPQVLQFLGMADTCVVVTTPNLAATLDAYGCIKAAREMGVATDIRLLVNLADDRVQAQATFTRVSGCAQRFLEYSPVFLGWIQRDPLFEHANQSRRPLLVTQPQSENAKRFMRIAASLVPPVPPPDHFHLRSAILHSEPRS